MSRNLLTLEKVKMEMRGGDLETVRLNGRNDLEGHQEIDRYINQHDAKISKIDGKFRYKNQQFDFTVSYATEETPDMGRVSVKKMGKATGDLEMREDAYDFLESLFEQHFVL